jgi:hypothetical protein
MAHDTLPPGPGRSTLGALVALSLLAVPARAQSPTSSIGGVVYDSSGYALPSADVRVRGTKLQARTNERGEYILTALPSGDLVLEVRRFGFRPLDLELALAPGEAREVNVELTLIATVLDTVHVEALSDLVVTPLQVFEQRKAQYPGVFYTREDIERRAPGRASDLLRSAPGVRIVGRGIGGAIVVMGRSRCRPIYWIDGRYIPSFELDQITPMEIQALEVYRGPSETPPELNRFNAGCGVIAIWTRNTAADRQDEARRRAKQQEEERKKKESSGG